MAQSLHIGSYGPSTNLLFGICAIYFDLKVYWQCLFPYFATAPLNEMKRQLWRGDTTCHTE